MAIARRAERVTQIEMRNESYEGKEEREGAPVTPKAEGHATFGSKQGQQSTSHQPAMASL